MSTCNILYNGRYEDKYILILWRKAWPTDTPTCVRTFFSFIQAYKKENSLHWTSEYSPLSRRSNRQNFHSPNFQIGNMLPDKRPRLIFFLYLITIAQYNSQIYGKIGCTLLKQSVYSLPCICFIYPPFWISQSALFVLVLVPVLKSTAQRTRSKLYSPLQNVRALGRVSYIDWIENLNMKTEILMNEKLPDQV